MGRTRFATVAVALLAAILIVGCSGGTTPTVSTTEVTEPVRTTQTTHTMVPANETWHVQYNSPPSTARNVPGMVTYSVGGTASRASLTIANESGGTEQFTVSIPWSKTFQVAPGSFLYLSAQNEGEFGTVTCKITSNGVVVQSANSSGAYTLAGCSGSAR